MNLEDGSTRLFLLNEREFKMLEDDYDVAISKQKISHFVNRTRPVQYWIALEPESEL